MERFETIDISGDAGIRAFGASLEEAFVNAALGMYSLVTDLERVNEAKTLRVEVTGDSREGLLVAWLNELIFHLDTYGFIGRRIEVLEFGEHRITADVSGEEFDTGRHESRLL
ncbi:MAG: archease, partial [Candidatus Dadabacteria bacterium]